jgi:hypothetical protein
VGRNPHEPRSVLNTVPSPVAIPRMPYLGVLRSPWTAWLTGLALVATLTLASVDAAPWALNVLPLAVLAGFLAVRSVEEWPRIGFPVCILGVGTFVAAAGLFKTGVNWSREWGVLRGSGALVGVDPGLSPVLGTALAVALGGAFLGVLFLHGDVVWRSLSSVRLAVVTLSSIGLLSVIGTMVVQRFGAGSLPEPEKNYVEKFMKGQGAIPVNAAFMLAPPEVRLTPEEAAKVDLTGRAFGAGKARQMDKLFHDLRDKSLKAQAIEDHVRGRREHLLRLFERLDSLGFTSVFRTWWFNALLLLLFVQVVAVLSKRYPWGWGQAGWVMTHVGVLVVLAGCVISDLFLKDGSLALSPGQASDSFLEYTRLQSSGEPSESPLGYGVRMLGTDQSFYHELQIAFPAVNAGGDVLWTQEQLRPGRRIEVKDPETAATYAIRIEEVYERAAVETGVVSAKATGRPGGEPLARVQFLRRDGHGGAGEAIVGDGWLLSGGGSFGRLPDFLLRYDVVADAATAKAIAAGETAEGEGLHGRVTVHLPGGNAHVDVPATPGATASAEAEGGRWTVTVQGFDPSYYVGKPPVAADADAIPTNPALTIEVSRSSGEGAVARGVTRVYAQPSLQAQWEDMMRSQESGHESAPGKYGPAAEVSCRFDYASPLRIVEGPDGKRTLVVRRKGAAPVTADLTAPGATYEKGPGGLALRLVEAIPDAVPDERIQPLHEESDDEYLATCLRTLETGVPPPPTVSVAKLVIDEKDAAGSRTRTEWLVAGKPGVAEDRRYRSTDGRLLIVMHETSQSLMFRSALEVVGADGAPILEDGKPVRKVVRVNHPLQWGGYAYYQNNFIAETARSPAASVFRVKYDRGITTLYTGFAVLTTGVCIMLYLNPALRRRREKRDGAAPAVGGA